MTRLLTVGLLVLALAGCGTTVTTLPSGPAASALPGTDDGLGLPPATAGPAPGFPVDPQTAGGSPARPTTGTASAPATSSPSGPSFGSGSGSGSGGPSSAQANRSPISIGIIYVNNDAGASAAGINNGNTFTPRRAFEALVSAYNARGGVAGRRINPVYVELRSSSASLNADIEAACNTFTQDAKVAAVWGGTGLYSESFSACLAKSRTPQLSGDYALGDQDGLRRVPFLVPLATVTTDDRIRLLLERLTAAGRLTRNDSLGVVVEGCPFDQRTYTRTFEPTAKRLGLKIGQKIETRCFEDIGDLGGQAADMQSTVLRFQTNRVTKVVFVSGSVEGNLLLYFATAAESQGYHPGYALTSAAAPAVQEANTPKAQLANAAGLGWLPATDTNRAATGGPATKRCLSDLKSGGGPAPQGAVDRAYAFTACDTIALYDTALRATLGSADGASVLAGISALGTRFAGAASHGERTDFGSGRRTGPAQGRLFAWSAGCSCFDYTGQPVSLTNR